MTANKTIYEIAILGRVTWNLHSLSNEGTIGNVTEPRTIVLTDETQTDGISGEMLKHIHAEYIWALENDKGKFCEVCKEIRPERADGNTNIRGKNVSHSEAVKIAISSCVLCDTHGFFIQQPNVSRESTVEFGWAVGIPEVQRSIHVQARHEKGVHIKEEREKNEWQGEKCSQRGCKTNPEESKLYLVREEGGWKWYCGEHVPPGVQMPYHRPTRSGIYGIVSVFQPWRTGLNNVNFKYDVNDKGERKHRYELVLKAYQALFLRTEGAMTTTRLPHTEKFEGVIVVATSNFPVPVISPIRDNYIEELEKIKNNIGHDSIEVKKFEGLGQFVNQIKSLLDKTPYQVKM